MSILTTVLLTVLTPVRRTTVSCPHGGDGMTLEHRTGFICNGIARIRTWWLKRYDVCGRVNLSQEVVANA